MRWARTAAAALVLLGAAAFAASGRWPWRRLTLPVAAPIEVEATPGREVADTLRPGETISELFGRHGVAGLDLLTLGAEAGLDPRRLRSGLVFAFLHDRRDSTPTRVSVRTAPDRRVVFRRAPAGWDARVQPIGWTPETLSVAGPIDHSLYEALDAGIPDDQLGPAERRRLAWDLADVYAWQVDFTRDVQPGDSYRVLLERLVSEEGDARFGRVLAGDLTVGGRRLTAVRFVGSDSRGAFYDAEGNSLRRAFLRAPLQFRRISSAFARARRHPLLGIRRRHEGTDYAAAPGTPVSAAGDGVVVRAGRAGGYGNLVEIRHRNGISTRYAHLRGFGRGIRAGVRVGQGQTIGYVGSTGISSGPHLHYEFRVNGVARDARRAALGSGEPVARRDREAFERERSRLLAALREQDPGPLAREAAPAAWLD